jgi:hypothetical protein
MASVSRCRAPGDERGVTNRALRDGALRDGALRDGAWVSDDLIQGPGGRHDSCSACWVRLWNVGIECEGVGYWKETDLPSPS